MNNTCSHAAVTLQESPDEIRKRDRRHVWHPWSPLRADRAQLTLSHGEGYRVWDIDGREYIDGSSLNTTCGYGHAGVVSAVAEQLSRFQGFDISTGSHPPVGRLAERLAQRLPSGLTRTLFVNSGSEAFEAALLIATSYWSHLGQARRRVVTFARGYHGSSLMSRSLTGLPRVGHPFVPPVPVTHVELTAPPREIRKPEALPALLAAFAAAIEGDGGQKPVAVIVEPFLNVGGGVVLPPEFLKGLRELCDATDVLLIIDEVFTGYGRCGAYFACHREGVTPDILVSSKGLASGYMPIAAVSVREAIHDTFDRDPFIGGLRYGHTTSGHAAACAAALATLDHLEAAGLPERAEQSGQALIERLSRSIGRNGVADVRGLGLILVIEMDTAEAASAVSMRAMAGGLLLRQHGEILMAVPALTIDEVGLCQLAERLEAAIAAER